MDGLIIMNDGGVTSRLVDLCEEAGVYIVFSDCGLSVVEEDDYSTYATSEYYLGHVAHERVRRLLCLRPGHDRQRR